MVAIYTPITHLVLLMVNLAIYATGKTILLVCSKSGGAKVVQNKGKQMILDQESLFPALIYHRPQVFIVRNISVHALKNEIKL